MSDLDVFYVLRDAVIAERLQAFVRANWTGMAQRGQPMLIHLMTEKAERSLSQNKYAWSILTDIAENGWVDGRQFGKEAWMEFFKRKFLPLIEGPGGEYYSTSTTTLSVKEFSQFIEKISAYAATELGLEIA